MVISKKITIMSLMVTAVHLLYSAAPAAFNAAELPAVIMINLKNGIPEPLNIEMTKDPFTQATFKDLIIESEAAGEIYILARATLHNKSKPFVYYDAHALNRYIFKTFREENVYDPDHPELAPQRINDPDISSDYPIALRNPAKYSITWQAMPDRELSASVRHYKKIISDPSTRIQIQREEDIDYYVYISTEPKRGFAFFCTYKDFINPENTYNQMFFYVNQHDNLTLKQNFCVLLGENFYFGSGGVSQYYAKAFRYFTVASTMTNNPSAQIQARFNLGLSYYHGDGVTRDYKKAIDYFKQGENQTISPIIQALSRYHLGMIYYSGFGVEPDFTKAFSYFTTAFSGLNPGASQPRSLSAQLNGMGYLAVMYYYGQGVAKDETHAFQLASGLVPQSKLDKSMKCSLDYLLAQMYLFGKGVPVDYSKASQYLYAAIDQSVSPKIKMTSQLHLSYMYIFGKGVALDIQKGVTILNAIIKQTDYPELAQLARSLAAIAEEIAKIKKTFNKHQLGYEKMLTGIMII
jgi:TPR repeat protein